MFVYISDNTNIVSVEYHLETSSHTGDDTILDNWYI